LESIISRYPKPKSRSLGRRVFLHHRVIPLVSLIFAILAFLCG
jgi:hypothetical protein